jgi:hypothetical protein
VYFQKCLQDAGIGGGKELATHKYSYAGVADSPSSMS